MNNKTKFKISISMRGRKKGARHKLNISQALRGRKLSDEHKDKIREAMKDLWKNRKGNKQ